MTIKYFYCKIMSQKANICIRTLYKYYDVLQKGTGFMSDKKVTTYSKEKKNDQLEAADIFSRLPAEAQDAIIDLIKSLLSDK